MPENLKTSSKEVQSAWLHKEVSSMLDKFVMPAVSRLPCIITAQDPLPDLPCRGKGCKRTFKYGKCRIYHEQKRHGLIVEDDMETEESKLNDK